MAVTTRPWGRFRPRLLGDHRPRVLTAAASRLKLDDRKQNREIRLLRQGWQSDAWNYYDSIGEVRYATNYLANCFARMRLYPAAYPTGGEDDNPVPLQDIEGVPPEVLDVCKKAQRDLGNGRLAIAALLHSYSTNMTVAGECFLLGEQDEEGGSDRWTIRSIEELIVEDEKYKLRELPSSPQGSAAYQELDPETTTVSRIWLPHPKFRKIAISQYRAILDDMESLMIWRRMLRAEGRSRLASRGILAMPLEMEMKTPENDSQDPETMDFLGELTEAMMEGLAEEGTAAAVAPIMLQGPAEHLDKIRLIEFATKFTEHSREFREELVEVIATGLDLPKEVITGKADLNHWSAWQVDDDTFRAHVEPHVITGCDSLTAGYLRPYLEGEGVDPAWVHRVIWWYDPTELVVHPDRSKDAMELFKEMAISAEALRRETGFSENDAPSIEEVQTRQFQHLKNVPPNLLMAWAHMMDPTLGTPPITVSGTVPGIKPGPGGGVDAGASPPPPGTPGAAESPPGAGPGGDLAPPAAPSSAPAAPGPPAAPVVASADAEERKEGVMVALFLQPELAAQVALDGGEPPEELHITLAFLGEASELQDPEALQTLVGEWAAQAPPLTGEISGVGLFTAGPEPVTYLSVDLPALPDARQQLVDSLVDAGQPVSFTHGFTPHCTLAYEDRVTDVQSSGEAISFDSVAIVVGEQRTDYKLTGTPPAVVAAGAVERSRRLSRRLSSIDKDLRTRLQTAANAALRRKLEQAGARVRSALINHPSETVKTTIAHKRNERLPAHIGKNAVVAAGVDPESILSDDWSALREQFMGWTTAAQEQALTVAAQLGELDVQGTAVVEARAALAQSTDMAWGMLENALDHIGHALLFNPDPNVGPTEWGALNPDTLVPAGTIRAALAVAGGAKGDLVPDFGVIPGSTKTIPLGAPIGQIGTGATITELLGQAGGALDEYEWSHGPSVNPFEPHEDLDGLRFQTFDSEALANSEGFPGNQFFFPGDHAGCLCDFTPLWVSPSENSELESGGEGE
jgi:2'-5' RNA ligase